MSASASPTPLSAVAIRLRSAGCVFAEDEAEQLLAAAPTPAELDLMVRRRATGHPLEHVLGWAEFCGLRITVHPGVFVPRRRTEFLATQAVSLAKPRGIVIDLCCGSGAVGAAIMAALGQIELYAADIDPTAVRCARHNVAHGSGQVHEGDLYDPLPAMLQGRVNVLVANAPYVPTDALRLLPTQARDYEPTVALDGGPDGLEVLRRVIAQAPVWLAPGGSLLVESSDRQAAPVVDIMAASGLIPRVSTCDDLDATIVIGTRPASTVDRM